MMRLLAVCVSLALAGAVLAQAAWTRIYPTTSPSTRYLGGMVYHEASESLLLLFGVGVYTGTNYSESWQLQGDDWALLPGAMPSHRTGFYSTYDASRERVVLWGGRLSGGSWLTETVEWDGTAWFTIDPPVTPPVRRYGVFGYDRDRQVVVLFGGRLISGGFLADTWEWDGVAWTQVFPATSPSPRTDAMLAFDPNTRSMILHGGFGVLPDALHNDTWSYDGVTWTMLQPTTPPPRRRYGQMVSDLHRSRVVLFGGAGIDAMTWEWDGSNWSPSVVTGPSLRELHHMAFDSGSGRVVLHGGNVGSALGLNIYDNDTWIYETPLAASAVPFGAGCAGSGPEPVLAGKEFRLPWLGDSTTNVVDDIPVGQVGAVFVSSFGTTAPVDLGFVGMPGCSLLVPLDVTEFRAATATTAAWTVDIPNDASLTGTTFRQQAFVVDMGANPLGAVASNGLVMTIGVR